MFTRDCYPVAVGAMTVVYIHVVSVLLQQGQGQLFTFGFCPVAAGARTVIDIWFLSCCSGGKDSCFNLLQCVAEGHQIVALANLRPKDKGESGVRGS